MATIVAEYRPMNGIKSLMPVTALIAGVLVVGSAGAGQAQNARLAMLDSLAKGEWTIRFRDGSPARKVCVRSGRELIQLQHGNPSCSRFVVEDGASEVAVQYTCPGNGYGRTSIRRETASLVQLESQGIEGGLPFQFDAEARRTGNCG